MALPIPSKIDSSLSTMDQIDDIISFPFFLISYICHSNVQGKAKNNIQRTENRSYLSKQEKESRSSFKTYRGGLEEHKLKPHKPVKT